MRITHQSINVFLVIVLAATYAPTLTASARKTLATPTTKDGTPRTRLVANPPFSGADGKKTLAPMRGRGAKSPAPLEPELPLPFAVTPPGKILIPSRATRGTNFDLTGYLVTASQ